MIVKGCLHEVTLLLFKYFCIIILSYNYHYYYLYLLTLYFPSPEKRAVIRAAPRVTSIDGHFLESERDVDWAVHSQLA